MDRAEKVDICVIGNLPPPINGQSLVTERMIGWFEDQGFVVARYDLGPGDAMRPRSVRRLARHVAAVLGMVRSRAPLVYLSVNNGSGMALAALLCAVVRLTGKALALHHHSLSYVTRPSHIMRILVQLAGKQALHIVQSDTIGAAMTAIYGIERTLGYSNIGLVEGATDKAVYADKNRSDGKVTLGYLANVTAEKGIYVLLAAFATLRKTRQDLRLIIAGPCRDAAIVAAIDEQRARFGADVEWVGGVYGPGKKEFFERIDIFVFPTVYATETQGLVNLEAMGAGVPVVAFDRGRIGEDIGSTGGVAVPVDYDFGIALEKFVDRFQPAMRPAVRARYETLLREHEVEKRRLLDWARQVLPSVPGDDSGTDGLVSGMRR
ncbi:glycosyltransferase family 4 protein [Sphingomonas zeae]